LPDQNLGNYGLSEPKGTVTLHVEGSDKPVVLQFGANPTQETEKERTYAKVSNRDAVVLVPKNVEGVLTASPNDLRDRNLIRVESDIVDRIKVAMANGETLVLARKGESWVRKVNDKDETINENVARKLLTDLQGTQVMEFVSDVATDLARYGLDKPATTVTLSSFASENTAETGKGDKPIVAVLFGKVEKDKVYVKLDNEPFIYSVTAELLDSVPTNATQLQQLSIYHFEPNQITEIGLMRYHQPIDIERDKDGQWKPLKGDEKVNQTNVQLLVNALSKLEAVRWIGPAKPEYKLEDADLAIRFTVTENGQKSEQKLYVGEHRPDDTWYARAENRNGVFLINRVTNDALRGPIIDKPLMQEAPKPAATPVPAPVTAPAAPAPAPAPAPATATPAPKPAITPAAAPKPESAAPAAAPSTPAPAPKSETPAAATPPAPAKPAAAASEFGPASKPEASAPPSKTESPAPAKEAGPKSAEEK
jgi:hypothetical protein